MKSVIALQLRSVFAACKAMVLFTVLLGLGYTGVVTVIGQLAFPSQANGSLIGNGHGAVVGSAYIGQSFTDSHGKALPRYFQSRPSATVDAAGSPLPYDAANSAGSNLGLSNADLIKAISLRKSAISRREGVRLDQVPADAVTASGSGLDYQISTAYADIQIQRVARARGLHADVVKSLVARYTEHRGLGFIGEEGVNVVELNAALDRLT